MEQLVAPMLIALTLFIAMYFALTFIPASIIKRRLIKQLARNSKGRLALTYDDGPGPALTPPLLQLLASAGARATFYLVGFRCERFPVQADEILSAGHEIGNHTQMHGNAWQFLGAFPWKAVRDVIHGYQKMSRWMRGDAVFRPPFGKMTTWTFLAARRRKAPLGFWTCDGGDTWKSLPDPDAIVQKIARAGGGVVLLHSHDRGEDRQRYVLDVTERLLRTARERGMRLCTMSEILHDAPADRTTNTRAVNAEPAGGAS